LLFETADTVLLFCDDIVSLETVQRTEC